MDVLFAGGGPWPAHLGLAVVGIALAIIDQRTHRLPDVIVLPTWLASVTYLSLVASVTGQWEAWERSMAVMAGVVAGLWLMAELPGYPLGFGDVKLGGVIATHLGWHEEILALVGVGAGFFCAGVWVVVLWVWRKEDMSRNIALGPWLVGGFGGALIVHRMATDTGVVI